VLYRFFGYSGHFGYDDMEYAEVAYQLTQGNIDFGNHFFYRFAIILPTAICYTLFGVNDIASSIPPIIASGLILFLVFKFMKKDKPQSLSLALSMTLFSEWFLFYGNKLMVDIYVCLAVIFVIYIIHYFRNNDRLSSSKYALLFALGLLYGFVTKGTIILIIPLLVFLSLYDFIHKRHTQFWVKSIAFTVITFTLYFLFIGWLSGDFMARFEAINAHEYINQCSYAAQDSSVVIKRITTGFIEMCRNEGFAFSLLFIVTALFFSKRLGFFKLSTPNGFFLSSSLMLFLAANFMSISPSSYNPMCLDFRHYLWLVPITAIAVAKLIYESNQNERTNTLALCFLSLLTLSSFLSSGKLFLGL